MIKKVLAGVTCVVAGTMLVGCGPTEGDSKNYQLNQTEITYSMGDNFDDLGLYLINVKNSNDKILVKKEMFADQTFFNRVCNDVNTKIVYDGVEYTITLNVTPSSAIMQDMVAEFLEKVNTAGAKGTASVALSLDTKYMGEDGTMKTGTLDYSNTADLVSPDYILNSIYQYALSTFTQTPPADKLNGNKVSLDLAQIYSKIMADLQNFDQDSARNIIKNLMDAYLLTEEDAYYENMLNLLITNLYGLTKSGEYQLEQKISENFAYFKNVEWEKLKLDEILTILLDDSYRKSGFTLEPTLKAATLSVRDSLVNFDGKASTLLENFEPLFLELSGKVTYAATEVVDGQTRYFGVNLETLDGADLINANLYLKARVDLLKSIENLLITTDLTSALSEISTALADVAQLNQGFIENNIFIFGGFIDLCANKAQAIDLVRDEDELFRSYCTFETTNERASIFYAIADTFLNMALTASEKEGNFYLNFGEQLLNTALVNPLTLGFTAETLSYYLLLDDEGRGEIASLLSTNFGGKTFAEIAELDGVALLNSALATICDHSGLFDVLKLSAEDETLLKNFLLMEKTGEGFIQFVSDNTPRIKVLLSELIAYVFKAEEAATPTIEAYVDGVLTNITEGTIVLKTWIEDTFNLAKTIGDAGIKNACEKIELGFSALVLASDIYKGDMTISQLMYDEFVIPYMTERVIKVVERKGATATVADRAFIAELINLALNNGSLNDYARKNEQAFKDNLTSVLTKYCGVALNNAAISGYMNAYILPEVRLGHLNISSAIEWFDTQVLMGIGGGMALRMQLREDIELYQKYMDGQITLAELGEELGVYDYIFNTIVEKINDEEFGEIVETLRTPLENLIKSVILGETPRDYIEENKETLSAAASIMICKMLNTLTPDNLTATNNFVTRHLTLYVADRFSPELFFHEFLNLTDIILEEEAATNLRAFATLGMYVQGIVAGKDVDFNEIFEYTELPPYIEEIDYNLLFEKIKETETLDKIFKIKTAEIVYTQDENQNITAEVLTVTLSVDFDAVAAGVKGDVTLSIKITD